MQLNYLLDRKQLHLFSQNISVRLRFFCPNTASEPANGNEVRIPFINFLGLPTTSHPHSARSSSSAKLNIGRSSS